MGRLVVLILLLFLFVFQFEKIDAQVFIPFAFYKAPASALTISDGATYNYGNIAISTNVDKTFTITNSGSGPASNITGASFSGAKYTFKGGTFPGTGGTCGTSISPSGSCTIVVTAFSAASGTFSDTVTVNYQNPTAMTSATRAITATFVSSPTQLAWVSTPSFIKVNDCVSVTVQSQDSLGNALNVGSNTTVTLSINNATNTNFYTTNACSTTTTSQTILSGANSVTFYVKSTTANQTGIFVGSATGLTAASQNENITNTPSKLLLLTPPRAKINTCNAINIYSTDANGLYSNVASVVTVNMTTTGANVYYSDSSCTATITSTTIAANSYQKTIYTQDATIQTATLTATDNAAVLTASSDTTNFATSLTWWNTSWTNRIRIDINNLDQASAFTNQPILVTLTSSVVNYSNILANGADIRFVASDDTTQIPHEIEKWNASGASQVWVRVPSIAASATTDYIYMYFNNSSASDGQNKTGIWTNYWAVWHLNENPSGTAPQYLESTTNARNGTATNSPTQTTGVIGYAADLSGATDSVKINQDLSPAIGASSTFSCWMKTTQVGNNTMWQAPGLTGVEQAGGGNDIFFGWLDASGNIGVTSGNGATVKSNYVVNNNAWRHVTITRDSSTGTVNIYINGVLQNSAASEAGNKTTYFDLLGEIGDTGGTPVNYNGQLDEVRIFNSVQSAAQIKADFKFMMNTNVLYNTTETYP